MSGMTGWYVALGGLIAGAVWNSQRPGVMTEERDEAYRKCLEGHLSPEKMRKLVKILEKARCYPQAAMVMKRIALAELPDDVKEERRQIYLKAKSSKNKAGVLRVARLFEEYGSTSSAERLRRHAARLPDPMNPPPIVTPPPTETASVPMPSVESPPVEIDTSNVIDTSAESVSDVRQQPMNGSAQHVSMAQEAQAVAN